MKPTHHGSEPATRSEATAPEATAHLSSSQLEALEIADEAEHNIGLKREELTKNAAKIAEQKPTDE